MSTLVGNQIETVHGGAEISFRDVTQVAERFLYDFLKFLDNAFIFA